MKHIPGVIAHMKCRDCGHEQAVKSVGDWVDGDGKEHRYFGSAYNWCDECDGLPVLQRVEPASVKPQ